MALVLADRVQETSATTGTGTLTLAGAVAGYQSFAVIGNGNTTYYTITSPTGAWEVGIGTYTSAGTTLSRTTVLSSSNAGSLVSFTGTLNVFVTYPAGKSVNEDEAGVVTGYPITVLDNAFTLQDNLDPTKQANFQLGSITTATTRAYTLPNVDTVLAGLAASQTFSNTNVFSNGTNTFGSATGTGTNGFSSGATTTGNTKTVNIGTGGLAGSTTAITIGGTAGTSTTTMNGQTDIGGTTTSVNFARIVGAATTVAPIISAQGSDANVNLSIRAKAAGVVGIGADTIAAASLVVAPVASSVNYLQVAGNTTNNSPLLTAQGADANIALAVRAKGTFNTVMQSDAGLNIHDFAPTATSVNWLRSAAAQTGNAPTLSAQGSDANINLRFTPKGTGGVWFTGPLLPNNLAGTSGQVLTSAGAGAVPTWTTAATGTVTSVAMTVPTGLSIAGTPITTSGTLALTLTAGYSIPTTASQTNWDSAFTQRLQWDGGATNLVAATGRTSLGATTVGGNFFTLANPTAITFPRINADNTVSALDAATFRTAIGAGTSSTTGTVTSVAATVPAFLSVTGSPITTSGTLAIAYSGTALPVANGGTGLTTLTAGYIPYGNGTSALQNSANFTYNGTTQFITAGAATTLSLTTSGSTASLLVTDTGGSGAGIGLAGNGATTPNKYIRAAGGTLQVVNNAYSAVIFQLSDAGVISSATWAGTTIGVAYGGTGVTTLTGLAYGNGTSAFTAATAAQIVAAIGATAVTNATNAGNATTATTLQTARTINGVSFNGSANITITSNTPNTLTRGTYLTGSNFDGSVATTWAVDATTTATASKVVARDAAGDDFRRYGYADYFNMSHGTSGATTDTIFYSSNDNFIRKNDATGFRGSLNVPTRTGGNASGTWAINVTGSAASVTGAVATNFTAQQYFGNVALTDAATIAWAVSSAQVATFTFVSSNRTMGAPTGLVNGGFYALAVIQNGGSNTLTWNAVFKWAAGTAPTLSTAAGAKDYFTFRSDGTNLYQQGISQAVA